MVRIPGAERFGPSAILVDTSGRTDAEGAVAGTSLHGRDFWSASARQGNLCCSDKSDRYRAARNQTVAPWIAPSGDNHTLGVIRGIVENFVSSQVGQYRGYKSRG